MRRNCCARIFPNWLMRVVAFILMLPFATAGSVENGWLLEKDENGIQVYTRAVSGWSIREFKGVTEIHASLACVVAVINDIPASRELTEGVTEAKVLHRESDGRFQIYSAMRMPWPISNRDILNQRDITQDRTSGAVTIIDVALQDGLAPRKGYVRIVNSRVVWTLAPIADGIVHIESQTLSDPAGPIPSSLINTMSVGMPLKTFNRLKEMVGRVEYAQAKLPIIEERFTAESANR
jgi:hypothetical protein